jgi:hypothetical protein
MRFYGRIVFQLVGVQCRLAGNDVRWIARRVPETIIIEEDANNIATD